MIRYEWKKILMGTGGRIALLLLAAVLAVEAYFTVTMTCCETDGKTVTTLHSIKAGRMLNELTQPWAGILDEERIQEVLIENRRVEVLYGSSESENIDPDIAYTMKQGFEDIRDLINFSFSTEFRSYDYYTAERILPDRAGEFYPNRIRLLKEWLEGEGDNNFSESEKAYLISQFETSETPFYYERFLAWSQLFAYLPPFVMIATIVMGYLVSRVFAGESQWNSDAIFFTSMYGRNKAVTAKVIAGISVVTILYFAGVLFLTGASLLTYGPSGWNCPVQVTFGGWKSMYNITIGQKYLIMVFGGYIGCIFLNLLVMLISAMTDSMVIAAMIPFVVIFPPSFLPVFDDRILNKVIGLWPDGLLNMDTTLRMFNLYTIGNKTLPSASVLCTLYASAALVLPFLVYSVFRRKQVR